jgi:hypothetical protein
MATILKVGNIAAGLMLNNHRAKTEMARETVGGSNPVKDK